MGLDLVTSLESYQLFMRFLADAVEIGATELHRNEASLAQRLRTIEPTAQMSQIGDLATCMLVVMLVEVAGYDLKTDECTMTPTPYDFYRRVCCAYGVKPSFRDD